MKDFNRIKELLNLNDNEIDNHETDLYIKFTEERYNKLKDFVGDYSILRFKSNIDNSVWLELPFYLLDDKVRKLNSLG